MSETPSPSGPSSSGPSSSGPSSSTQPGRRSAPATGRRRPDLTTALALALPVLVAVVLLAVRPPDLPITADRAPSKAALTSASVICPAAQDGAPQVYVTGADETAGDVSVGLGEEQTPASLLPDQVTTVPDAAGRIVVTGEGALAPGLVAARYGTAPLSAVDCPATEAERWFTAVGAGANHDSVLELVNPNAGVAVADIEVYAGAGVLDVPQLRGVSVPGGQGLRLDLGEITPRRGELALHVTTVRGRLTSTVLDRYDELGAGATATDWLPAQAAPRRTNLLLGLPAGSGSRSLVINNPADDEVRATVRFVTADSTFVPEGLEPVSLQPGSTTRVSLSDALQGAIADGVVGVQVDAEQPVTATLRSFVEGDLSLAVPGDAVSGRTALVVPPGEKTLQVAGASGVGVATVVARSANGAELLNQRVELTPDRGFSLALPADAVLVQVTPERVSVEGSVLVTGTGAATLTLRELVRSGLVPAVRPGLP